MSTRNGRVEGLADLVGLSLALTVPLLIAGPALAARPAPAPALPHATQVTSYAGPETCLACHDPAIPGQVFDSVHFQVRSATPTLDIAGGGSHGMADRACGLPGTTMMANNFAGKVVSPVDPTKSKGDGCGNCHITYFPPYYYATPAEAQPHMDCLYCHAQFYGEDWEDPAVTSLYGTNTQPHLREPVTTPEGYEIFTQDRSLKTAQSVGGKVSTHACLRCHEHGLSGYKRSTPFTVDTDVHAARGFTCTTCHTVVDHKIARGNYVTDGGASDLPGVEVGCMAAACHSSTPHALENAAELNRHVANVSCEVCHVHSMDEPQNIFRRAWAPFTLDPVAGRWETTAPTTAGLEHPGYWDAWTEYLPIGERPTIRWFNGKASMLAQPYGGYADRRSAGGDARLFAFKPFVSGMLFDAAWLPGPSAAIAAGTFDPFTGTWPASMKAFYEANWPTFLMFGFVDPAYPTAASYWAARPDMAYMLNAFPMMVQFDRKIFMAEAGAAVGVPLPGPQSAATYPGIAKAIDTGMGKMAVDMGYAPPGTPLADAGKAMWSGTFFGMWVPPNMDPGSAFYGELGSMITMSHAITSNASYDGTACFACHYTADEYAGIVKPGSVKYLSFAKLGYPDRDANGLIDPMYDRELVAEVCTDAVDNDGDGATDCADSDCAAQCVVTTETACSDGLDDDRDGLVDCADPDCLGIGICTPENVTAACSDGVDNDGDGLVDCADPGCAKNRVCR